MLCKTLAANDVDLLTITNFATDINTKQYMVVTARVHPGETGASYTCKGLIDFLISNHEIAKYLRNNIVFKIVPMLNPDGVVNGNYRCSVGGLDLNRQWKSPSKVLQPTIYHVKQVSTNHFTVYNAPIFSHFKYQIHAFLIATQQH